MLQSCQNGQYVKILLSFFNGLHQFGSRTRSSSSESITRQRECRQANQGNLTATVARKLHSRAAHSNWTLFLYCPRLTTEKSLKELQWRCICYLSQQTLQHKASEKQSFLLLIIDNGVYFIKPDNGVCISLPQITRNIQMRDEVLIKRQLVAMVTWILANKRVGEKCLLGDGKKRGKQRKEGRRQTERNRRAKHSPRPKQPGRMLPCCFSSCIQKETQVTTLILLCSQKLNMLPSVGYPG